MNPIGQTVTTRGARIAGVCACVPAQVVDNSAFAGKFGQKAAGRSQAFLKVRFTW